MGTLKFILNGCSFVFVFAALFYLAALIRAKWNRISWRKAPIPWSSFNPFSLVRTNPILLLALIAGLTNIVLSYSLASTEMGAFYEKSEYTQDYEATLDIGEKPVFCIATVDKWVDEGEAQYWITKLSLPYGSSAYVDSKYDTKDTYADVSLGDRGWNCKVTLKAPANSASYAMLENEVVSNYGEFCGSRESSTYHLSDCGLVKNIKNRNLVYFETQMEAEALGYIFCAVCADKY